MSDLRQALLAVAVTLGVLAAPAHADGGLEWKRPAGGWTHSGLADEPSPVTYAYPNNLIDRGGQRQRTLIEGKLKQLDKSSRRLPTLIVNGNPMPLYTGDDGSFGGLQGLGS